MNWHVIGLNKSITEIATTKAGPNPALQKIKKPRTQRLKKACVRGLGIPENQKETYNKKTSRQENRGFALFQPKSHRKNPSGRSPGLAWQRRQPSHAKAQWQFSNIAEIIGLTVAVTTRDLHPLPYSLDCGSATKHLKVMKRTCSTQQPHPTTHFKEWSTWYKAPMKKKT